jgi:hypothetical protein
VWAWLAGGAALLLVSLLPAWPGTVAGHVMALHAMDFIALSLLLLTLHSPLHVCSSFLLASGSSSLTSFSNFTLLHGHTDVTESNDDGTAFCTSYCGWHWVFGYTQTDAVKFGFIGECLIWQSCSGASKHL